MATAIIAQLNARAHRPDRPGPRRPKRVAARANRCRAKIAGFPRCQLVGGHEDAFRRHVTARPGKRLPTHLVARRVHPTKAVAGRLRATPPVGHRLSSTSSSAPPGRLTRADPSSWSANWIIGILAPSAKSCGGDLRGRSPPKMRRADNRGPKRRDLAARDDPRPVRPLTTGLSRTEITTLMLVNTGAPFTPSTVSVALSLTTGTLTKLLDRREACQLIRREPHPGDRRRLLLTVTAASRDIADRFVQAFDEQDRAERASRR